MNAKYLFHFISFFFLHSCFNVLEALHFGVIKDAIIYIINFDC